MMSALLLSKKNIKHGGTISDKIIHVFQRIYTSVLNVALQFKMAIIAVTVILFGFTYWQFSNLGGEFMPTLEEGDLALHQILPPGSSLEKSVEVSTKLQDIIMENFPEVEQVVTKIGTAEIPTDLMSMETV